ncbi:uncharacterized protein LOC133824901 [Humulus lupulus]|uniref:uncharacterized protein LOC133824901 n=1 Tax=Humulus lupulus TaxID=3486 RepID=UPI002B408EDA|nr:uncharacterized protein LOC133824901 [Humulus lupulus]
MAENEDRRITHQEETKLADNNEQSDSHIQLNDSYTEFIKEIKVEIQEETKTSKAEEGGHNRIGWLPQILRRDNQKFVYTYCHPRELPIGPLCYDPSIDLPQKERDHLKDLIKNTRDLKINLARKFVEKYFPENGQVENVLKKIKEKRGFKLQFCEIDVGEDALVRILFLDGCTILQFIESYMERRGGLEEFGIDRDRETLMVEDLFLLQNQIPFQVIVLFFELMKDEDHCANLKMDIVFFLHMNNFMTHEPMLIYYFYDEDELLQIRNCGVHVHLLFLLHSFIAGHKYNRVDQISDPKSKRGGYNFRMRSVQELKSAGLEFKPTSTGSISFSSKCFKINGHLNLPPLIVNERTEYKLKNLVAYEMSLPPHFLDQQTQYPVISYVKFIDVLIDKEEDVKVLRASRVIQNHLSSDADVATLINKLGSECFNPPHDLYKKVRKQIETHCQKKRAIWMAQVCEKHFSSPWTIVALLAAALILLLTATQTWYAIRS